VTDEDGEQRLHDAPAGCILSSCRTEVDAVKYRFEHRTVGPHHVITSPDLPGFHVYGENRKAAEDRIGPVLEMYLAAKADLAETGRFPGKVA
jgi:hypothetical protein